MTKPFFRSQEFNKPGNNYDAKDDLYANKNGFYIDIFHVPTGESVQFKAFVTQFDDQFQSEFGSEEVFGRMDSIQVYKGTTRQIGLGWDVPSSTETEAVENMKKCARLMNMLYPVYQKSDSGQGNILNAPPVFKVKFANLIRNTSGNASGTGGTAQTDGLFGTISGFSYSPDMTSGFLEVPVNEDGNLGSLGIHEIQLIPQTISLACQFTVVHTHDLGFTSDGPINKNFPFGVAETSTTPPNTAPNSVTNDVGQAQSQAVNDKITGNN